MRVINTIGQMCPGPLIATKRALKESEMVDSFEVLTDNKTALDNISRFLKDNNIEFYVNEKDNIWAITVIRNYYDMPLPVEEENNKSDIPHFSRGDFIIVFNSDKMGEGDEELGRLLLSNFISAIKDLDILPGKMVFYNSGVRLGTEDSPVVESLKEIENMGVSLLMCSTCTKYYSLEDKIKIGTVSNMYEIAQVMASAGKIVKP